MKLQMFDPLMSAHAFWIHGAANYHCKLYCSGAGGALTAKRQDTAFHTAGNIIHRVDKKFYTKQSVISDMLQFFSIKYVIASSWWQTSREMLDFNAWQLKIVNIDTKRLE